MLSRGRTAPASHRRCKAMGHRPASTSAARAAPTWKPSRPCSRPTSPSPRPARSVSTSTPTTAGSWRWGRTQPATSRCAIPIRRAARRRSRQAHRTRRTGRSQATRWWRRTTRRRRPRRTASRWTSQRPARIPSRWTIPSAARAAWPSRSAHSMAIRCCRRRFPACQATRGATRTTARARSHRRAIPSTHAPATTGRTPLIFSCRPLARRSGGYAPTTVKQLGTPTNQASSGMAGTSPT